MSNSDLFVLIQDTMNGFTPFYQQEMQQAVRDTGVTDGWFSLTIADAWKPQPATAEKLNALFPYSARKVFEDRLVDLEKHGYLKATGEAGAYQLTDSGLAAARKPFEVARAKFAEIEMPLSTEKANQLLNLLKRVVNASFEAPEPSDKSAIQYSRGTDPGHDSSLAAQIDQYLTDLIRFRDDAHLAAWQPIGVSAHAWEALTFIWRDGANSAAQLAEKLSFRQHSVEDYDSALSELVARGWLTQANCDYAITEAGLTVRTEAEAVTERYFFVGWTCLSEAEQSILKDLLAELRDQLKIMTKDDSG